jgi:hypothetical protein
MAAVLGSWFDALSSCRTAWNKCWQKRLHARSDSDASVFTAGRSAMHTRQVLNVAGCDGYGLLNVRSAMHTRQVLNVAGCDGYGLLNVRCAMHIRQVLNVAGCDGYGLSDVRCVLGWL